MLFKKIANNIEMSFDIPDSEKEIALEAKSFLEAVSNNMKQAVEHLDNIYTPFKEHDNITTESLVANRGILQGRFSTKIKNNFNKSNLYALLAIRKLNYFSNGDSDIREIINSFKDAVKEVGIAVSNLLSIIKNDLEDLSFKDKVISQIDLIKNKVKDLNTLIDERIIDHINVNILSESWMYGPENKLNINLMDNDRIPLIMELKKEREERLNLNSAPVMEKKPQSLNAGDAQQMWHSDFVRIKNIGE